MARATRSGRSAARPSRSSSVVDVDRAPKGWGSRGWRVRGGGSWGLMPTPRSWRGTSVQVCGLWPFAGGSSRPVIGVPVGQDIETGSTVCCDPFSWFASGLISSPSMAVFGLQGLGKSSFAIREMLGVADRGIVPLVAGDLKGEYTQTVEALDGQVLRFGEGQRLNVLDLGSVTEAAHRLGGERGDQLLELGVQRSVTMIASLVQIARQSRLQDWEHSLVSRAVRILVDQHRHARHGVPATLPDLVAILQAPPVDLQRSALVDTPEEYALLTRPLNRSLQAIMEGPLGSTFAGQSTTRIDLDAPAISIDISPLQRQSQEVLAAVMLASWAMSFASIEVANALADAGLEPQRHFLTITDEMWRPMRLAGAGLIDQYDAITRLNRNEGVGNIFITHSPKDYESMGSEADNMKGRGFIERSGIVVTAGLARPDLRTLSSIKAMSEVEIDTVASWSTPPGWVQRIMRDPITGQKRPAPPPGAGKILIKIGERAGIQTQVKLTPTELALHDTNMRWVEQR